VRDHGALRFPGRARGIDQDGQVVLPARADALLPKAGVACGVIASERTQRVQAHDPRVLQVAQPLHVEHHDPLQARQPFAHLQHLVELLLVLDEHEPRVRVGEEILHLGRGVRRVDAVRHAAGAQYAEIHVEPFPIGIGLDRGDIARLEAECNQPHPDLAHDAAELFPSDALPDAELLLAQDHLRPALGHEVPEHLRDVGEPLGFRARHRVDSLVRGVTTGEL